MTGDGDVTGRGSKECVSDELWGSLCGSGVEGDVPATEGCGGDVTVADAVTGAGGVSDFAAAAV